jgi:hypothetical protein
MVAGANGVPERDRRLFIITGTIFYTLPLISRKTPDIISLSFIKTLFQLEPQEVGFEKCIARSCNKVHTRVKS